MTTTPRRFALSVLVLAGSATSQVDWTQVQTTNAPPPFNGSCWDSQRNVLVSFGGNITGVPVTSMREWDGSSWNLLAPSPQPAPRGRPSLAFDEARGETVMFGGTPIASPETWTWDGTTWTQKTPANQPTVRFGAAAAYDRQRQVVVLFGGFVPSGQDSNEVFEWDGTDWTQVTVAGTSPTPRGAHRMVWDASRGACVVVGGFSTPQNNTLDDVWSWDGTSWSQLASLPGTMCDQAMCYDPTRQRILVNSGLRITNGVFSDLSDTLEFDGAWTARTTPTQPIGRNSTASAWDTARGEFVTAGGTLTAGALLADTWTYRPVSSATVSSFGVGCFVTNGVQLEERSLPYIGLPFEQAIVNAAPAAGVGLVVFGGSNTVWASTPLPFDLNSIGAPSCSLLVSLDVALTVFLNNGQGSAIWNLPNVPAAVGSAFYTQGVVLDPTSPLPFQIDATDGRAFTIGNP